MRTVLGLLGLALLLAVAAVAPNLIWLVRSTARVSNESGRELRDLRLELGGRNVVVGSTAPGQSRFIYLPEGGEATLNVVYWVGTKQRTGCQEYVEGSMYHVDVVIGKDLEARCSTTLPLFDRLFWQEAF